MTEKEVGTYPEGLHQPEQRHLDREQPGLREHRLPQQLLLPPHHITHTVPHMTGQLPVQLRDHRVERLREHRERGIQLTPHPQPLTPLPTEQQGHPGVGAYSAHPYVGAGVAVRQ
ncbi:putative protein OS=Streptomyces fumanus OX=67302 GN=GCM10018772_62450 PE=4 SV=1 [Streptomyces fumanus]